MKENLMSTLTKPLPTQHDLPYEDGVPMDSEQHFEQANLLIEPIKFHWRDKNKGYVAGNMFIYFSERQLKNEYFRGPDVFVVKEATKEVRKSYVLWDEDFKRPDVVIELLSESTAEFDKGKKKLVYQNELVVPEYFLYDPFSFELTGFRLKNKVYRPVLPDQQNRLYSEELDLCLTKWEGEYKLIKTVWLRWCTKEGYILPTIGEYAMEKAEQEKQRAEQEKQRAEQTQILLEQEKQRNEKLQEKLISMGIDISNL